MDLFKGDCLEVMKSIQNNSVDCVILDLPYGTTECKWDTKIDLEKLWEQLLRVGKETTPYFFFCDMRLAIELVNSNPKMYKRDLIWDKKKAGNPFLGKKGFRTSHEYILIFYKKQPVYNWEKYHKQVRKPVKGGVSSGNCFVAEHHGGAYEPRMPLSILQFEKEYNGQGGKKRHPTEKPVPLLEHIIKYYTNEGDLVLDPTMGSGSTGEASRNLNRRFIGIEMDDKIYETTVERLK